MSHDFKVTRKQIGLIRVRARRAHVDDLRLVELLFEACQSRKPRPDLRSNWDAETWLAQNLGKFEHKHVDRLLTLIEQEPDGRSETEKALAGQLHHRRTRRYGD